MSLKSLFAVLFASTVAACASSSDPGAASSTANDTDDSENADATLTFGDGVQTAPTWTGDPNEAWTIKVVYDFDRLPECRNTSRVDSWVIDMSYRIDGGETHTVALPGSPGAGSTSDIITMTSGAKSLEVWFENHAVGGYDNCSAWDSQYGANYTFTFTDPG